MTISEKQAFDRAWKVVRKEMLAHEDGHPDDRWCNLNSDFQMSLLEDALRREFKQ